MIIPPERVVQVCRLGLDEAGLLLAKAKEGDLSCLANWTIFSAFRGFLRELHGDPEAAAKAEAKTTELFGKIEIGFRRAS